MNLTSSFLLQRDKLVIGPHLLLSPASTVVKPQEHKFTHRPNPIQEGRRNGLSRIVGRSFSWSVEEQRSDTQILVFCKILGLICQVRVLTGLDHQPCSSPRTRHR